MPSCPREDADESYRQLAELTITEELGTGITLHELARKALLADLRLRNPVLERDLRRRIVDYLYARGIAGDLMMMIDLAHLVENPLLRWGFGWDGNASFRIDSVRPDDAGRIDRLITEHNRDWWQLTRRYFDEAPDRVAIARNLGDSICGFLVSMSLASAPAFADSDPIAGPWLAHARRSAGDGESVMWHAAVDFTQGQVQAMLGIAGMLRCGAASPRFAYLPIDPALPGAVEFAGALGAAHLAELDLRVGDATIECHRLDYGPGGIFSFMRIQIYAELGLPGTGAAGAPGGRSGDRARRAEELPGAARARTQPAGPRRHGGGAGRVGAAPRLAGGRRGIRGQRDREAAAQCPGRGLPRAVPQP